MSDSKDNTSTTSRRSLLKQSALALAGVLLYSQVKRLGSKKGFRVLCVTHRVDITTEATR